MKATPFPLPHRAPGGTAALLVEGPNKKVLWVPDADTLEGWDTPLEKLIGQVEAAFVDGTFYSADELGGRDMAEVPHPLMKDTLETIESWPGRDKVQFIHLNHTNPQLSQASEGVPVAQEGAVFSL